MTQKTIIQDRILNGILTEFNTSFNLNDKEEKSFEKLVGYIVFSKIDPEAFDEKSTFSKIDMDKKSTFGIDTIGIFINGTLIDSIEQISDMRQSGRMDVKIIFIQSKISSGIDSGEILKFSKAVSNFLSENPSLPLSEELEESKNILDEIFKRENTKLFKGQKPVCELYYANTGSQSSDELIKKLLESEKERINKECTDITCHKFDHIHKDYIIDSFNEIDNSYSSQIEFKNCVVCEKISDVEQAYIGFLPVGEFLKLITGIHDGRLLKNIFYENVRDFQGSKNSVNSEIDETLKTKDEHDKFILLNNGVTIVAKTFQNIRSSSYEISNYFIVNGCQTSTTIFNNKNQLTNSKLQVPIKIIHTQNEDLISKVIRSTNRQTPVADEAFVSLEKFHKRLQQFYKSFTTESPQKLHYERRSREFAGNNLIEKYRIITLHSQIKTFSAIILNEPHLSSTKNPSSILKALKENMFKDDHKKISYYFSSLILFVFYRILEKGKIDGKYEISRFWICWIARIIALDGRIDIGQLNSRKLENDINNLILQLSDEDYAANLFNESARIFETVKQKQPKKDNRTPRSRDLIKSKTFRDEVKKYLSQNKVVFTQSSKTLEPSI